MHQHVCHGGSGQITPEGCLQRMQQVGVHTHYARLKAACLMLKRLCRDLYLAAESIVAVRIG